MKKSQFINAIRSITRRLGIDIVRYRDFDIDFDPEAIEIIRRVRPYTMTSASRLFALIEAIRYVARTGVEGDILECGVWRGGSMMAAALTLIGCGDHGRNLYLFDTFGGMSKPTDIDISHDGCSATSLLNASDKDDPSSAWCNSPLNGVRDALLSTGYDAALTHFVKGRVEETVPTHAPRKIAVLRLDTDWYESTRHELEHLYPRLAAGGVLIIDDYGHWTGCRRAVDEFITNGKLRLLLNRIDYTGRIAVKIE